MSEHLSGDASFKKIRLEKLQEKIRSKDDLDYILRTACIDIACITF